MGLTETFYEVLQWMLGLVIQMKPVYIYCPNPEWKSEFRKFTGWSWDCKEITNESEAIGGHPIIVLCEKRTRLVSDLDGTIEHTFKGVDWFRRIIVVYIETGARKERMENISYFIPEIEKYGSICGVINFSATRTSFTKMHIPKDSLNTTANKVLHKLMSLNFEF
ncbi:uncharacterized protein LOC128551896 [Mercenaria mercenaria]|uniref:uncharacterized protein LOC128551896 n=1 Tax=Mercenaria mercenaria TaxID=6596 RepID=UPI00234F400B|nr:uncharacterized protein LOC128551896 [Mercenaria mercenaria]